ncbi:chloride channel protein [Thalassotalea sp. PLHSN55]|uniref:chloride channel protein n=1 Tax=Thalassotalea sp. PLHSN55 TaxID=3435888 RepID=UPI003F876DDC
MLLADQKKPLAQPKTSWQLCLLAAIVGVVAAFLIIAFNYTIELIQLSYLPEVDNYISLSALSRFDLPIIGALVILLLSWFTGYKYARTGIPFVLHRLKTAHGIIPFRNTINQFFGSAVALATGFSVGREGPAVHLGAACSSFIGNYLQLPYNSVRTLCACGVAAGIAASFNTPIAAVVFVMEVILREYKVYMFIPIMLAAIVGTMITNGVYGFSHEYEFFTKIALGVQHYPALVLLGLFLGVLAFLYNRYLVSIIKYSAKYHIVARILAAGFITGTIAYFVPYAMANITVVDFSLENQWHLHLLVGLLMAKFVMTICALGLGVPGGTIGPIISIGAIAGTCASVIVLKFMPGEHLASDFALMGMAGFLAATLNAPLAALLTVVELSNQIEIVVPAMIVITTACLSSGQVFNNRSLFIMQLDVQGLSYRKTPIEQSLQKIGVLAILKTHFAVFANGQQPNQTEQKAGIDDPSKPLNVIKIMTDGEPNYYWLEAHKDDNNTIHVTDHKLMPLSSQSTLAEVYVVLVKKRQGAVYIYDKDPDNILGLVTFEQLRLYLLTGKLT